MDQKSWECHKLSLIQKYPLTKLKSYSLKTLCKILASYLLMKRDLLPAHVVLMALFSSLKNSQKGPAFCFYGPNPNCGKTMFAKLVANTFKLGSASAVTFDSLLGYKRFANKTLWENYDMYLLDDSEQEVYKIPKNLLSMLFDTQPHVMKLSSLSKQSTTFEADTDGKVFLLTSNSRIRDDNDFLYLRRRIIQVRMNTCTYFHTSKYTKKFDLYLNGLLTTIYTKQIPFCANKVSEQNHHVRCTRHNQDFSLLAPYFRRASLKDRVCLYNALYTNKHKKILKPLVQYLKDKEIIVPDYSTTQAGYFKVKKKKALQRLLEGGHND